ncbi:MAG: anthranilate synthase component I family protein [Altibacter sp.]|uniref:anthranilate synthase component I family protein n=1 Tax=Altibacter sp. TaxID=2024823 RepID=UPI001E0BEC8A|nr:anthranilate synthase component I family protein [Altibacter sp.]MBZ0328225.1 anthranilate synthase component I family protein [Altibacter sp.]
MRFSKKISGISTQVIKKQALHWAQQFDEVIWLDSNNYDQDHSSYQAILAVDAFTAIKTDFQDAFTKLEEYQTKTEDWLFGYLTYDLKNDTEQMASNNFDGLQFPDLYFFQPKKVFLFSENEVEIQYLNCVDDELDSDWRAILNTKTSEASFLVEHEQPVKISLRTSKDAYFEKVNRLLAHIHRGDLYEANFCQEFYSENTKIDPFKSYHHLNEISKPPFATYLKLQDLYLLSASPERYLKKTGDTVVSQPIKGTAKRLDDPIEDQKMTDLLRNDPKERSENIMITDLVRNDLSRIAEKGSVRVEELCKVYTFKQVHQLISTISCQVAKGVSNVAILKNTFPMGSMTGAPKVSAMQIIEKLEDAKRGLYSGTVGYFAPNGDFDFNVIIRSILYNAEAKYVSFSVGGAITAKSIPENEYEECLLKAKAMREVLEN